MKKLLLAVVLSTACAIAPMTVRANVGGGSVGSDACPGGVASWSGTQTAPTTYIVNSSADIKCYTPQVNVTAGDTTHTTTPASPQPAGPCSETATSQLAIGPLSPTGTRTISWWDPNSDTVVSGTVDDKAAQNTDTGFLTGPGTRPVLWASSWLGSNTATIPWKTKNATWVNGVCTGTWERSLDGSCGYVNLATFLCAETAAVQAIVALTFTPPPAASVAPLLTSAEAQVRQQLSGGQVTSEFATGSVTPKHGLIVRTPVCFWAPNATVNTTKSFGMVAPQAGAGRALVVNYVASAAEDQTWWDFGDGTSVTQAGVDPTQSCAVTKTYYHVSADVYGSLHHHTSPPGQTFPFPDTEPVTDSEAVVVWHHIHFALTAYYTQTDGTQVKANLPGLGGTDFWVASQPEWVKVEQIESVPYVCPCPGGQ